MIIDWRECCMKDESDLAEIMTRKETPVLGHLCETLKLSNQIGGGCIPNITAEGFIRACDDGNPVRIEYCPYCGVKL